MLADHPLIETKDLDEAREQVAKVFCSHGLSVGASERPLHLVHNRYALADASLHYVDYGASVRITPGELNSFYLVQIPLAGRAAVTSGAEHIISTPTVAAVPNATEHLDMVWDADSPHLVVYLPRLAIDRAVESLTGRTPISPVRFKLAMDLDNASARRWLSLIDVLKADADSTVAPLHDAVRAQIEDAIMLAFVTTQTSNYSELISDGTLRATPRAIRRAMGLCDESPGVTWTVTDLAAASGVSVRSLQVGFRTYVGMTPLQYLRDVRLLRAREELESDSVRDVSVTDTAFRWGFSNVGRFASEYRARFGELPSRTIARSGKPVLKTMRESSSRCA